MTRPLILATLLSAQAMASPVDGIVCHHRQVNRSLDVSPATIRLTTAGAFAAWRCKSNDFVTTALQTEFNDFRRDPGHQRMNAMLAKHKTGNWRTDPKLIEVWGPYKAQIEALK